MGPDEIKSVLRLERMSASQAIHLLYLKELYNSVELVSEPPDWKNCFNVTMTENIENELEVILNHCAGYLFHHGKIAIKIVQMPNVIFIKTNQGA